MRWEHVKRSLLCSYFSHAALRTVSVGDATIDFSRNDELYRGLVQLKHDTVSCVILINSMGAGLCTYADQTFSLMIKLFKVFCDFETSGTPTAPLWIKGQGGCSPAELTTQLLSFTCS